MDGFIEFDYVNNVVYLVISYEAPNAEPNIIIIFIPIASHRTSHLAGLQWADAKNWFSSSREDIEGFRGYSANIPCEWKLYRFDLGIRFLFIIYLHFPSVAAAVIHHIQETGVDSFVFDLQRILIQFSPIWEKKLDFVGLVFLFSRPKSNE